MGAHDRQARPARSTGPLGPTRSTSRPNRPESPRVARPRRLERQKSTEKGARDAPRRHFRGFEVDFRVDFRGFSMRHATDCTLASRPSKSRYSPIVDAISGKRDFRKTTENRSKIDPSALSDAAERRFRVFFAFASHFGAILLAPGRLGTLLGAPFGSPKNP